MDSKEKAQAESLAQAMAEMKLNSPHEIVQEELKDLIMQITVFLVTEKKVSEDESANLCLFTDTLDQWSTLYCETEEELAPYYVCWTVVANMKGKGVGISRETFLEWYREAEEMYS